MSPAFQEQVPTPPAPPAAPGTPSIYLPGAGRGGIFIDAPLTARDVQALRARGSELSNQLQSANRRRDQLSRQLEDADGLNKQGIEQRIAQLDQRIMGIEADIADNGRRLASAPARALPTSQEAAVNPFGLNPGQITAISIVGTLSVLLPLSLALARRIMRRGSGYAAPAQSKESAERMERLEQAVDAIAIEIERVSEGQRFVTRLLTEGSAPALSVGQKAAEPVRLPERESLQASRETA